MSMFGADFENRIEAKLIQLERSGTSPPIVGLVDREQDGHICRANGGGNVLITMRQSFATIDDENDHVSRLDGAQTAFKDELVQRIVRGPEHPAGVGQLEPEVLPHHGVRQDVAGRAGDGGDNRPAGARQAIEKGGLADVGTAHENDGRETLGGHLCSALSYTFTRACSSQAGNLQAVAAPTGAASRSDKSV
jgi:hypothetical protein